MQVFVKKKGLIKSEWKMYDPKISNNLSKELTQQTFLPCKRYTYSAKVNWQNQHLQNVEDEGFNSFDRTHTQA